jgi:predicted transcriptional regulator
VAKLDADKVRWIRRNRHGFSCKLQAALLGVHYRTVQKVRYGETWCHID